MKFNMKNIFSSHQDPKFLKTTQKIQTTPRLKTTTQMGTNPKMKGAPTKKKRMNPTTGRP